MSTKMNRQLPLTLTARDLRPLYEAFSEEDDENGNPIFLFSSFGYITHNYEAYFGQCNLRKQQLCSEDISRSLELLSDDDVYPSAPMDITTITDLASDGLYLKGPMLNVAFKNTGLLPKLTLNEVRILEVLQSCPHGNIVPYYGCVIRRDRIVCLAFKRLSETLYQRMGVANRPFDVDKCMDSVTSVVRHLHSLNLAHNDLNPANIMVDDDDKVYVIDFGSCREVGQQLITAGTRGWIDEDFTTSHPQHDMIALDKIHGWLKQQNSRASNKGNVDRIVPLQ
ncbi:serine/threonine-protein kinase-like protein [Elsinoe ampelina]|uniref:Serine/threonine-protein kinase-like protein n=1 Tax=Elsinoe ampelina TaxID=302913 RepID=A0A6A6G3Q7_9PEZI|nr:serine/threonine-protein kinase-like protein [Elsinoe ampelina]